MRLLVIALVAMFCTPAEAVAAPRSGASAPEIRAAVDRLVRQQARDRSDAVLATDPRLDAVARWAAGQAFRGEPPGPAVREQLWAEGVRDFEFLPITLVADGSPLPALEQLLQDRAVRWERYNHLAVAVRRAGERAAVCVLLSRRLAVTTGDAAATRLSLPADYSSPRLYVTAPDGSVAERRATPTQSGWVLDVRGPGQDGRSLLELVADGPTGPEVLSLWPSRADGQPGSKVIRRSELQSGDGSPQANPYATAGTAEAAADLLPWIRGAAAGPDRAPDSADAAAAEGYLRGLIDATRAARGLPAIQWRIELARAARQHARELGAGQPFGHETTSGTALDRVAAHGLVAARATENVAAAADVAQAHGAFLASPAHRANLLDPAELSGGVGVLLRRDDQGRWSAVSSLVFARILEGDALGFQDLVVEAIQAKRAAVGYEPFAVRGRLSVLAGEAADAIAERGDFALPEADRRALVDRVRFYFNGVEDVGLDVLVTADPDGVQRVAHITAPELVEVGAGVRKLDRPLGPHPAGSLLVVLIFVNR